jgi:GDP-L-fucose synthase
MREFDEEEHINIGTGQDLTIRELALLVRDVVYPEVDLAFDETKPDGSPQKLLDVSRIHDLGWRHTIDLRDGIAASYDWYLENVEVAATS